MPLAVGDKGCRRLHSEAHIGPSNLPRWKWNWNKPSHREGRVVLLRPPGGPVRGAVPRHARRDAKNIFRAMVLGLGTRGERSGGPDRRGLWRNTPPSERAAARFSISLLLFRFLAPKMTKVLNLPRGITRTPPLARAYTTISLRSATTVRPSSSEEPPAPSCPR